MRVRVLSRTSTVAALPVAVYATGLVLSWLWSPVIFERTGYTAASLAVLAILLAGATWGVVRRIPLWSYSWIFFSLWGISGLLRAVLRESAALSPMSVGFVGLITFAIVIIVASLLGARGKRFAVFAILLALLHSALSFPILEGGPLLSASTARVATSAFAILAVAEAAFVFVILARFPHVDAKSQVRSLYLLAAVVFIDPVLTGWSPTLQIGTGGTFFDSVIASLAGMFTPWIPIALSLLLVWVLSKGTARLNRQKVSQPT